MSARSARAFVQRQHDAFQGFLFAAHVLGAFRVVPDRRIFDLLR
jgi:hypothetical protein